MHTQSLLWKQAVLTKVVYELDYLMCNVRQYNDYLVTKLTADLRGRGVNVCAWTHDCSWDLPFSFMMCALGEKTVYLLTISTSVCSSSRPTTTSNHCCCLMANPPAGRGSGPRLWASAARRPRLPHCPPGLGLPAMKFGRSSQGHRLIKTFEGWLTPVVLNCFSQHSVHSTTSCH